MNILLLLIPLSIMLLAGAVYAFFWAVDHHQLDDFDAAPLLPLIDATNPSSVDEKARKP